jgi:hypothetical protein
MATRLRSPVVQLILSASFFAFAVVFFGRYCLAC